MFHCQMGISRSVSLVVVLLLTVDIPSSMHVQPPMSLLSALDHVKRCRPQAQPTAAFLRVLVKWEDYLGREVNRDERAEVQSRIAREVEVEKRRNRVSDGACPQCVLM